jgi:hypothetical protein
VILIFSCSKYERISFYKKKKNTIDLAFSIISYAEFGMRRWKATHKHVRIIIELLEAKDNTYQNQPMGAEYARSYLQKNLPGNK